MVSLLRPYGFHLSIASMAGSCEPGEQERIGAWLGSCLFKLKGILSGLFDGDEIITGPIIHHFPNVGTDGHISIDCIVRPAARSAHHYPSIYKDAHGRHVRVAPKRVGVLVVEVNQYGLTFDWKPGEVTDDRFLSPFGVTASSEESAKPSKDGRGDGSPCPLGNLNNTGIMCGHDLPNK